MRKTSCLLLALLPVVAAAETKTWVAVLDAEGTATSANANVAENWDPAGIPTSEDDIVLDGERSNVPMVWTVAATGASAPTTVKSWTQKASYTSRVTIPTTRTGVFTQLVVRVDAQLDGGEWWRDANAKGDNSTATVWLNVKVDGDLSVGAGFKFNGEAAGYPKQRGISQGGEKGSTGGAHGGLGGGGTYGHGTVYGDYRNPTSLGSGQYGGDKGGGGAIILDVTGDFLLEGQVNANAGNGGTGSGQSGGSVWIKAKTLSGGATGLISANGGSPSNKRAGGGAGRISVQLSDPTWTQETLAENFKGTIRAIGGYDSKGGNYARVPGASGTVYLETAGDLGKGVMRLVNSSWSGQSPHNAVTLVGDGVKWDVTKLEMANNGRVGVASGGELHVPSFSAITGDATVYSLFAFIGGAVTSDVKHDKFVASGFDLAVYASTDFGDYHLEVPADRKLSVAADAVFTVGSLKVNGTKLPAGEYVASSLTETYPNVSGAGTIKVLGLTDGLMLIVR